VIEQELLDYIRTEIAYDSQQPLGADDPLLDGALDSVGVLRLVVFIEERYSVSVGDDDLVPENFATVTALAELLRSKQAS
jgi:acyl carrier protein